MNTVARFAPALVLLALAQCSPDRSVDNTVCRPGADDDHDGLANDLECTLHSDPLDADSDDDGAPDATEVNYPKLCVARVGATQRRPAVSCTRASDCAADEDCRGLDPQNADSDGDGVPDREEDIDSDGVIERMAGETDPRLRDTDGDGRDDRDDGLAICRASGLASVNEALVPTARIRVGSDPRWGTARPWAGTSARGALLFDDADLGASGAVIGLPTVEADVRAESRRVEDTLATALGTARAVLVGRAFTTHEGEPAIASSFRVARTISADALRDASVAVLTGARPTARTPLRVSPEFYVEVTTVRRVAGTGAGQTDVIVVVSPRVEYDDVARPTAARASDLANATGVARAEQVLGSQCDVFRAGPPAKIDFLWTVDTSGSMGDDQMRLGATAVNFFQRLNLAGVDFRVAVFQAGSAAPDFATPGFRWIRGTEMGGAQKLCQQVTSTSLGRCLSTTSDDASPYPIPGGEEEPVAAAVVAYDALGRETDSDRKLRADARTVAFMVTDEPGTNDFTRYFGVGNDPMRATPWGARYDASTLGNIVDYFRRNAILTFGMVPAESPVRACSELNVADLPRCVIEGNGGAVIPVGTASSSEVDAAVVRIIDAAAGATSQFHLTRSPVTSTLKVRVRGVDVPRSRAQGFEYDPVARTVLFFGDRVRPHLGDEVVVSYRVWRDSPN